MDDRMCKSCEKSDMYEYSELDEADAGAVATGLALGGVAGAALAYVNSSAGSYNGVKKIFDACNASGMGKSTMNGGTLDSISKQVRTAVDGWGTDEDAIKSALGQIATIPDLCAVNKRYAENYPGSTLLGDLDGDIDSDSEWNEYVYQPLLAAKRKSEEIGTGKSSGGGMGAVARGAKAVMTKVQTNWGGTTNDPNRYWNALAEKLKAAGIGVKTENPNFMYWGMWVINKNYTANEGYPISVGKGDSRTFYRFADYGGKYAGQALDKINVIMKGSNTPVALLPLLKQKGAVAGASVGAAGGTKTIKSGTATKTPSPVAQSNVKQVQKLVGVAETGVFDDVTAKAVRTKLGI